MDLIEEARCCVFEKSLSRYLEGEGTVHAVGDADAAVQVHLSSCNKHSQTLSASLLPTVRSFHPRPSVLEFATPIL